ncbi:MAG: STAS/SEC14 domain-containing protein [Georgfuchsia sp.]
MLHYELCHDQGIPALNLEEPLQAADVISIASQGDTYPVALGKLHGVLTYAKFFPGWKDYVAMLAHLKFLDEHIRRSKKVVVIADGALANIMPNITRYFVHTQVRRFDFVREATAWDWLRET